MFWCRGANVTVAVATALRGVPSLGVVPPIWPSNSSLSIATSASSPRGGEGRRPFIGPCPPPPVSQGRGLRPLRTEHTKRRPSAISARAICRGHRHMTLWEQTLLRPATPGAASLLLLYLPRDFWPPTHYWILFLGNWEHIFLSTFLWKYQLFKGYKRKGEFCINSSLLKNVWLEK